MKKVMSDETIHSEASTIAPSPGQTPLSFFSDDPHQSIQDFVLNDAQVAIASVVFSNNTTRADSSLKRSLKIGSDYLCIDSPIATNDDPLMRHGNLSDVSLLNALALDVPSQAILRCGLLQ